MRNFTGTVLAVGDWQYPFIDWTAYGVFKKAARLVKPDVLIFLGDMYDFDGFSRRFQHTLPGWRRDGRLVRQELSELGRLLHESDIAAGGSKTYFLGGNHEERPQQLFREQFPILDGLVTVQDLLGLKGLGIEFIPYTNGGGRLHVGHPFFGMTFLHGYIYRQTKKKDAGAAALAHLDRIDTSVCHGHTNRCVAVIRRRKNRTLWGVEAGTLCSLEAQKEQYNPDPDAQHGFAIVRFEKGRVANAHAVRIVNGECDLPLVYVRL